MTDWTKPDPDALQHWRDLAVDIGHVICTIGDCDKPHRTDGMCYQHYLEMRLPQSRRDRLVALERKRHGFVPVDDVEWLLDCHPRMTVGEMAPRFDVQTDAIRAALKRAGRTDLLDRRARNAELAGHSVRRRTA